MKSFIKLFLIVAIGGLTVYTLHRQASRQDGAVLGSKPASGNLKEAVEKSLEGSKGTYAIAIKNLKTEESFYLNEHRSFEAGSLYKLWVLATTVQQLEKSNLNEEEQLNQSVRHLNAAFGIDPDSAELTDGVVTLTVTQALNQMITISHNYATYLLVEKIGNPLIRDFLRNTNLKESVLEDPSRTTTYDLVQFFEKLYKGELSTPEGTRKMLDILKKQKLNDKLPRYLPEGTVVAHKTGEIDYLTHDVGIVFSDKGDYIIAVMSESAFPPGAEERIAELSKNVYDYFQGNQ